MYFGLALVEGVDSDGADLKREFFMGRGVGLEREDES